LIVLPVIADNGEPFYEDDLVKIKMDVMNTNSTHRVTSDFFGFVKKSIRLKNDDLFILPIRESWKTIAENKRKHMCVYEISIYVRYRKYATNPNMLVNIQVHEIFFSCRFFIFRTGIIHLIRISWQSFSYKPYHS
jgi:hypothetical protein